MSLDLFAKTLSKNLAPETKLECILYTYAEDTDSDEDEDAKSDDGGGLEKKTDEFTTGYENPPKPTDKWDSTVARFARDFLNNYPEAHVEAAWEMNYSDTPYIVEGPMVINIRPHETEAGHSAKDSIVSTRVKFYRTIDQSGVFVYEYHAVFENTDTHPK